MSQLEKPAQGYEPCTPNDPEALHTTLSPGDVMLVEVNIGEGVVAAPLFKYARFHTPICLPIGLTDDDRARVCAYATERIALSMTSRTSST